MVSSLKRLLKQKRKRLTTWELIARKVAYLDSFAELGYLDSEALAQAVYP